MPRLFLAPAPAVLACLFAASTASGQEPTADQARFFETSIRPLLVEHCIKCHGPDKAKGGLRLDGKAAAVTGGDSGPAITPGKIDESLLIDAVKYEDDTLKMPPNKKLPAEQVADLTRWVEMGAPWPGSGDAPVTAGVRKGAFEITDKDRQHWAFRPLARPEPPKVDDASWSRNPVDAFVFAGLQAKGLAPNDAAAKGVLIRRATYDLTGLPPTPAEVDAFVADARPDAYEQLIERLLASPRYGEKWGRHWLDLVRFAETNSYERDGRKPHAWRYRDYVIRSFNDDKPFDRFVKEQLAGDELPDATNDSQIATGYYRLGIWDDEPTDRDQARYDSLDDIVATTGQVFLGMTIDCARCHDHKIDPIAQKDYYSLLAFFQNTNHYRNGGPTDEFNLFESDAQKAAHDEQVRELESRRNDVQKRITAIERVFREKSPRPDEAVAIRDLDELRYRYYRDSWEELPDFDALKFEDEGTLPRGRIDIGVRSRDESFGFVFEGFLIVPEDGVYTFHLDSDDGSRLTVDGRALISYDGIHGEGVNPQTAKATLRAGRTPFRLDYFQNLGGLGLTLGWSGPGVPRRLLTTSAKEANRGGAELAKRIMNQGERVLGKAKFHEYRTLRKQMEDLRNENVAVDKALVVTEPGPEAPETHVLLRGNPQAKGDVVEPAFPTVLSPPTPAINPTGNSSGRRLALAEWIVSPENPMTARVMANRIWQHHFGRGIVRSSSNFGTQGDAPTHPELLDWLASEFIARGWSQKALHRTIMTSNAYRMSSAGSAEGLNQDPTNDALWRFDMRRLTAEEVRDSILAVSGSLNTAMFGPGVFPEIPAEVLAGQSVPGKGWDKSTPEEQARRSVYVHVKRSLLVPILESYDVAETDRSSPVRFNTTQPTQALAMINGAFLNRQAAVFADRLKREAGDAPADQVRLAMKLALSRDPSPAEIERGVAVINTFRREDRLDEAQARQLFALIVLNLDEFVYLD